MLNPVAYFAFSYYRNMGSQPDSKYDCDYILGLYMLYCNPHHTVFWN